LASEVVWLEKARSPSYCNTRYDVIHFCVGSPGRAACIGNTAGT
jgi:hypothetical protein